MAEHPLPKQSAPKKLGLALGSGAARGWAHIGVLQGLEEIGVKPDVIAGCSVGALVGGAYLLNALDALEAWARELKPVSAFSSFSLQLSKGGLVDTKAAFEAFRDYDRDIEALPMKFGAVATDLGTGEEIWLTQGSTVNAARASSAIPVLFHAVRHKDAWQERWLVDGALVNPTPISLARHLGADIVIAVDLNAVPRVLERFDPPPPSAPVLHQKEQQEQTLSVPPANFPAAFSENVTKFIEDTRRRLEEQMQLAKQRQQAKPQLLETAYAAADIFQMQLSKARRATDTPDICLAPDMRDAFPHSFDRADEFVEVGRQALLAEREALQAMLGSSKNGGD